MKQIHLTNNQAPKVKGAGFLKYKLWVDDSGSFYVQIEDNAAAGTFSKLRFSVAEYAPQRKSTKSIGNPIGLDLETGKKISGGNNDDGAFLKAVLCHLLDEKESV